ncbi:hypothetical protein BSKO_12392 [Bryopsis sp. KO-2023]|nr:hypothetical protein BSKO_12392 [Bryopsis sp. KO-2023]
MNLLLALFVLFPRATAVRAQQNRNPGRKNENKTAARGPPFQILQAVSLSCDKMTEIQRSFPWKSNEARPARLTLGGQFWTGLRSVAGERMILARRSARLLRLVSCSAPLNENFLLSEVQGWRRTDGGECSGGAWDALRWSATGEGSFRGKCLRRGLSDNASRYRDGEEEEGFMDANLRLLETWGFDKVDQAKVCYGVGLDKLPTEDLEQKLAWLTKELEFPRRDVAPIIQGHPSYLSASLTEEIAPFVQLFLIEAKHKKDVVRKIVTRYPPILTSASKFEASFEVVSKRLGLGRLEWLKAVSKSPSVMKLDVEGMGKAIDGLLANGFDKEEVVEMVISHPFVLALADEAIIKTEVGNIRSLGVTDDQIKRVACLVPQILEAEAYRKIRSKISFMREHLGFTPEEALDIFVRYPKVFFVGLECWKRNCKMLGTFGLSNESVGKCIKKSPYFVSWDAPSIKEKFDFALGTLKKTKEHIVEFPDYFRYSLESRIMLRAALYDVVGRDYTRPSLHSLLTPGKSSFNKKFGKKWPPSTVEWFEAKWGKLTKDQKILALKNKSYWEPPEERSPVFPSE